LAAVIPAVHDCVGPGVETLYRKKGRVDRLAFHDVDPLDDEALA
jgi:hypothetical protein